MNQKPRAEPVRSVAIRRLLAAVRHRAPRSRGAKAPIACWRERLDEKSAARPYAASDDSDSHSDCKRKTFDIFPRLSKYTKAINRHMVMRFARASVSLPSISLTTAIPNANIYRFSDCRGFGTCRAPPAKQ